MQPVPSTAEIIAYKMLNRGVEGTWANWAVKMLMVGFDTENLVILAGIYPPYNQFELRVLTDKVFKELNIDYTDKEKVLKNYASYLVSQCLAVQKDYFFVLNILRDIWIELDGDDTLNDFNYFYWAKDDLLYADQHKYYDPAFCSNIDSIIKDYFESWLLENPVGFGG